MSKIVINKWPQMKSEVFIKIHIIDQMEIDLIAWDNIELQLNLFPEEDKKDKKRVTPHDEVGQHAATKRVKKLRGALFKLGALGERGKNLNPMR